MPLNWSNDQIIVVNDNLTGFLSRKNQINY